MVYKVNNFRVCLTKYKKCVRCNLVKSQDKFYRDYRMKDCLKTHCKECSVRRKITKKDVEEGFKYCHGCGETLAINLFWIDRSHKDGLSSRCGKCKNASRGIKIAPLMEYSKYSKYNISEDQYLSYLKIQNGCCALCGKTPEQNGKALSVDHNHRCCGPDRSCGECVRGLLCAVCNTILGFAKDDESIFENILNYLRNNGVDAGLGN